jgi:CubicO group peptidase (beta-lactamase class C family)
LLKLPLKSNPGSKFEYSPRTTYLLSGILTGIAGMNAASMAKEYIWSPLKASSGVWHTGPEDVNIGGEFLYLRPADIAKFGCLYLNGGKWKDRAILPEEWVKESLKIQVDLHGKEAGGLGESCEGYGYGFVVRSIQNKTVYTTEGDGSLQSLCIIPELDIAVVVTTYHSMFKDTFSYKHLKTLLQSYIIPAAV